MSKNKRVFTDKEKEAFKAFKADFKEAKSAKNKGIDQLIAEWNDLYYGESKQPSKNKIKSAIVMKEIAKQIELQKPNITEPFLSTSSPISVSRNGTKASSKPIEKYLNNEFTTGFERDDFINELTDLILREGTAWVASSWINETKIHIEKKTISMEEVLANPIEPDKIDQSSEDPNLFDVEYKTETMEVNCPSSRICRNEHIFPDPGAKTNKEMRFLAEKQLPTLSDLHSEDAYCEDLLKKLSKDIGRNDNYGSALAAQRETDGERYGQSIDYQPDDDSRKKISIIKFWSFYDLDEDGVAEPVLCTWADKEDLLLELEPNPMPSQTIPYENCVYSSRPFSLWGNAMAYFIGDYQAVKSGVMRGILDNMSMANNGQQFVLKGGIDYINFKRMRNGERHILLDKKDSIENGTYNPLPQSIFSTLALLTKETEDLSGVNSNSPALGNDSMSKDNTNGVVMTMSQQRMAAMVRNIAALISKLMKHWVTMAEVFLDNSQIQELFTQEETQDIMVFKNSKRSKIDVNVATEINRTVKMQHLNMLLQQSKQLGKSVPPQTFNSLVAQMFSLFDMHEKAAELESYVYQPSEQEQIMMQLEQQKLQLEVVKLQADIQAIQTKNQNDSLVAQTKLMDSVAGSKYKQAQSAEKMAKAQGHSIDSSLKPAQFISEVQERRRPNERPSQDKSSR